MTDEERKAWRERLVDQKLEVKLLFDENLPRSLKTHLRDVFPGSLHVADRDLLKTADTQIWEFAAAFNFAIVTKDGDFVDRAKNQGPPPSVIQIASGNSPTWRLADLLRESAEKIKLQIQYGAPLVTVGRTTATTTT